MDVLSLLALAAKLILLPAGLIVPGAAWMRALRLPRTVATCFAGSAVSLYATVLALQFLGVPIALGSLAAGLAMISAAATLGRPRTPAPISEASPARSDAAAGSYADSQFAPFTHMGAWTPLYLLFWAAMLFRAWHDPLAGPDIEFRWSFLAEQMLRFGSLDFYPPRSAADFLSYFWVESIPPGASALHAWAYACAGGAQSAWTVPAVVLQLGSLHELSWRIAERSGGLRAARYACLAVAACPLLTWSVLVGQETGLTALSLIGIAFALQRWHEVPAKGWAALAGIFAVLGASAREYGLVFPLLAAGGLVAMRADGRTWRTFLTVVAMSIVWPLRTWALTGNPFYSLAIGGLFPINERFGAWIAQDADAFGGTLRSVAGWREVARYLLLFAPTALLGWIGLTAAAALRRRGAALALGTVVVLLAVWGASVRYTNGGLFYSLRVASPALALGALVAGIILAALGSARPRFGAGAIAALGLFVVGLLPAGLALPRNPWPTPWREWPAFAPPPRLLLGDQDETVALIRQHRASLPSDPTLDRGVVLADSPGYQRRFLAVGIPVIPLWSPQADWLFDARLTTTEAVQRWRESGVRHIVITKWQSNLDFFNSRSRWSRPPFHTQLVGETNLTAVFAIRAGE